ncbi:MAG TPA: DNA gyrase subunit A, partial [Marmoricola sp.]|nr:DNA gyrase subunit A [Marmoricola sp.]
MARSKTAPPPEDFDENIIDIDVGDEMRTSFLEYAYSVIYSRALPDARDGLKPVQRRILYSMYDMGLRPERGHVKSSRVVGEVMGRFHPHGDSAIYDALVRMAQDWSMRLATVDGHGNFGSPDDSPAAMRYTECRMAPSAVAMTASIDEDTVDFRPNYDGREVEPSVLPAAIPHLIVNGGTGIAVGMATNLAPHNLVEVIQALRHLIKHPNATLDSLMRFIPGPDLPTGGKIIGLDGIRDAYETGRGSFKMRATARIESITPRRKGIVVTELPYGVGTERVSERIRQLVQSKKLQGISDLKDLTDRQHGLRLVIEIKNGFHPEAILEQLCKSTPLEENFGINAVALVDGQPKTLGLKDMLQVFLEHRFEVVLHGVLRDEEPAGDLAVGVAERHLLEDVGLPCAQPGRAGEQGEPVAGRARLDAHRDGGAVRGRLDEPPGADRDPGRPVEVHPRPGRVVVHPRLTGEQLRGHVV